MVLQTSSRPILVAACGRQQGGSALVNGFHAPTRTMSPVADMRHCGPMTVALAMAGAAHLLIVVASRPVLPRLETGWRAEAVALAHGRQFAHD